LSHKCHNFKLWYKSRLNYKGKIDAKEERYKSIWRVVIENDLAKGQMSAFYDGDRLLGGGVICWELYHKKMKSRSECPHSDKYLLWDWAFVGVGDYRPTTYILILRNIRCSCLMR